MGDERAQKLEALARLKEAGERAYDQIYEAHSSSAATAWYSDTKENFHDAIGLASELGLSAEAEALRQRLAHIKAVFRSQFAE